MSSLLSINIHIHANDAKQDEILRRVKFIEENMATQADIDTLTQQAVEINEELRLQREASAAAAEALRAEIVRLEAIIAGGVQLDLQPLRTALQILDDINPGENQE
jgi:hypothetical protein